MAKVQFQMPEDFLLKLSRLGEKTDEILPRVLEAGGAVVLDKVRANLQAVVGRDTKEESRSTGELVVTALFADVLSGPEVEFPVLTTLPRGALVTPGEGPCPEGWRRITLPDGQNGYTKCNFLDEYCDSALDLPEEALRARVVERAKSYLGVQYRWGGKSPMGIDCSGLTFMSWFFSGVLLYRDAKLVPGYPARAIPLEQCRPADLLYFPGHIALYLGEGRYIHSTARAGSDGVVINSLDPDQPDYRADLPGKLLTAGTVFPLGLEKMTTL